MQKAQDSVATAPIPLRPIEYQVNRKVFTGWLADGSNGSSAPGILVAHEGTGLTQHAKQRAAMLASRGLVAFAMDIFGEQPSGFDQARAIVQKLRADAAELHQRGTAALAVLKKHPQVDSARLAAIGFCFGGTLVLELARRGTDLQAAVGFHAGLLALTKADPGRIRAKVLVCQGAADPMVDAAQRDAFAAEMTEAGADWRLLLFGGVGHSFTNPEVDSLKIPGCAYNGSADRRSWRAMEDLLAECFE